MWRGQGGTGDRIGGWRREVGVTAVIKEVGMNDVAAV